MMTPGRYAELFFLDEATALAAGHRPCSDADCQRKRHQEFKKAWYEANAGWYMGPDKHIGPIDDWLHGERAGARAAYRGNPAMLPDGALLAAGGGFFLAWGGLFWKSVATR